MTRRLHTLLLVILIASPAASAPLRESGLVLLSEPVGARAAALSGALSAVGDDQTTLFANPASAARLLRKDFTVSHHSTVAGIRQIRSGWAYGNGSVGIGLSLGIHTAGGLETRTGPTIEPIGTFNFFEFNAGFTLARRLKDGVYAGFTARFLHEDLEADRASGFGLDLGLTWQPGGGPVALAASLLNVGRMDDLDRTGSSLPREIRLGAAWTADRFIVSSDFRIPRFGDNTIHVGGEFAPVPAIALRLGYQSGHDTRTLSYGLGLTRRNWRIDYAFVPTRLGFADSHRITLGIR